MFGTSKKTVSATGSSEPNTHLLRIKVVRAISLRERGLLSGPVDSYVKILLQTRENGNQTIDTTSTRIVPKTINPTWNQEFVLHVNPAKQRLAFEIYDRKNAVQDAFLGTFFVDLTANIPYESAGQSPSTREYALLQQNPHQNVRGNATVQLSYVRQPTIIPQKEVIDDRPLIKHVSPVTELPLPSGWEEKKTANGRTYYINHKTRTTTWERPKFEPADSPPSLEQVDDKEKKPTNLPKDSRDEATLKGSRDETSPKPTDELGPLPAGWDMTKTERGRPLFIDHINKRTTWTDPRKKQSNSETLPENWKVAKLPDGRKCYVDQLNKKTSWTPPSIDEPAVPYTCDYQSKYQTFRRSLPKPKSDVASQLELPVDRKDILETSVRAVMSTKNTELFKTKLSIVFDGERGSDHDRLTSHWFFILSREMSNPYYGLFEYSSLNSYTIQINPLSGLGNEEHIKYFRFVGRIIGMALYHEKLLSVCLSPLFFKLLLSKAITLADIESIDQEYYQSLTFISENDPTDLELHFVGTEEVLGDLREYELKPGGKKILVTQKNKQEYIELAIQYRYVKQIELQMNALKQGIEDIFPLDILKIFDEQELETLISGTTEIDLKDWRTHTMYKSGYTPNAPVIENFWKAIESFDNKERADLLRFVTDSSRLPLDGFRELMGSSDPQLFTIAKWDEKTKIPRSNTRFNRLYLPPYDSYEDLREKLIEAVKNGRTAQNEETIEEVEETSAVIEKAVITVEKGDLTKQKVDVIIGSSSSTFLKKALLEAAGNDIETAYDNEYKKNPNALLIPTDPGALHCQKVFFIKWEPDPDEQLLQQSLIDLITIVIQYIKSYNFTSIAFPAIGCGKHGCSRNLVIKTMVNEMKKELIKRKLSWVVKFVIQPDQSDIYDEFCKQVLAPYDDHITFQFPSTWEKSTGDKKRFTVSPTSDEFKTLVSNFNQTMNGKYSKIIQIERIQNERWYTQYLTHNKDFKKRLTMDNEKRLYHGCSQQSANSIIDSCFNRAYAGENGIVYGRGVYFSSRAVYSHGYAVPSRNGERCMFVARVFVGKTTKGNDSMKVAPTGFDSTTDGDHIFVTYHDAQALGEYLITYK